MNFFPTLLTAAFFPSFQSFAARDTVSVFAWSSQETDILKKSLSKMYYSSSQGIRVQAAKLLNTLFLSSDALLRLKHPSLEKEVTHSVISIKSVLEKSVALPLQFDADFSQMAAAIVNNQDYQNLEDLSSHSILSKWYRGESISGLLQNRALVEDAVVCGLRELLVSSAPLCLPRKSHPVREQEYLAHEKILFSRRFCSSPSEPLCGCRIPLSPNCLTFFNTNSSTLR